MCALSLERGCLIPQGISSSTPAHGREGIEGIVIIHVWARKSQVIPLPLSNTFPSALEAKPCVDPSLLAGKGEREKLS